MRRIPQPSRAVAYLNVCCVMRCVIRVLCILCISYCVGRILYMRKRRRRRRRKKEEKKNEGISHRACQIQYLVILYIIIYRKRANKRAPHPIESSKYIAFSSVFQKGGGSQSRAIFSRILQNRHLMTLLSSRRKGGPNARRIAQRIKFSRVIVFRWGESQMLAASHGTLQNQRLVVVQSSGKGESQTYVASHRALESVFSHVLIFRGRVPNAHAHRILILKSPLD